MSANGSAWYAGRFARRRGTFGAVDVLAISKPDGWEPIVNARKLFPKTGNVEVPPLVASTLRPGDWLAFQIASNTRPNAPTSRVSVHRMMPKFASMEALESIEAARALFTREGWESSSSPGHWAIRCTHDRIVFLDLERGKDGRLRTVASTMVHVACYGFDPSRVVPEPVGDDQSILYDPGDALPLATYDWSPGADYIAHVVRALAGADDPRLPELITWLELHCDETGRISATGADHEKAFEALRSGELAARLSADRELMTAYLAAVRDDPAIAAAVAKAAVEAEAGDREAVRATLRSELAAELADERSKQKEALRARASELEEAMHRRVEERRIALEKELNEHLAAIGRDAATEAQRRREANAAEVRSAAAERDELLNQIERIRGEITALTDRRNLAEEELAQITSHIKAMRPREAEPSRTLVHLTGLQEKMVAEIDVRELGTKIADLPLLSAAGKASMMRFVAYLLAGEIPVLQGSGVEDFALVAEALIASGRLVPFDADRTTLTPEDVWSRPGSGMGSPVAQAAGPAALGEATFLVQLRGIDRSAARVWYPALAALSRRGLLPRRLFMFATVMDATSEEATALPADACRMTIEDAVADGAWLAAPGILGAGPAAISCHLDPGARPADLSPALSVLTELGVKVDVATSLRLSRVVVEAMRLQPDDTSAALTAAREFCRDAGQTSQAGDAK